MSRARKLIAAFTIAALPLAGAGFTGEVLTAAQASAATPSCGASCLDVFSRDFGTHANPQFVMDVLRQGEKVGQPLILFRQSNADPAEDFTYAFQGLTSDFFAAGLVSPAVNLHYGNGSAAAGNDDPAFEVEYSPYGVESGLCVGLATTAMPGERVTLQPCGTSAKTVWIIPLQNLAGFHSNYAPPVNGSDTNFSHPFVLSYPQGAYPTDTPRPQLQVQNLTEFSNGSIINPSGVVSYQLWGADFGVLK